jgi:hypothetical protein
MQALRARALAKPAEPPAWRKLINLRGPETLPLRNAAETA